MPYDSIDWNAARNQIAKEDLYYPHPMIQVWSFCYLGQCIAQSKIHCAMPRPAWSVFDSGGFALRFQIVIFPLHSPMHSPIHSPIHNAQLYCIHTTAHTLCQTCWGTHMCTAAVLQDVIWWALYKAEAVLLGSWLRKKALDEVC